MAKPIKWGKEFLVNTTTSQWQTSASLTGLSTGGFVAAWEDNSETGGDASSSSIRAQLFNADGSKAGAEFLVNTATSSLQYEAAVAKLADGRFAITWTDKSATGGDTEGEAIRGQIFNADGSKAGAEFLVNSTTEGSQFGSVIASLTSGHVVVAWTDLSHSGGDTSDRATRAQVLDAAGNKIGPEILVNTSTAGAQHDVGVAGLLGGGFVVTWQDEPGGVDTDGNIRAQIFNAGRNKVGPELLVNTTVAGEQYDPTVTTLASGRFVVTWTDSGQTGGDSSGDALRGQVYNANGTKSGGEFLINATTSGNQQEQVIAPLADGSFVVAWLDSSKTGGDTDKGAIRAQVFGADGSKSGEEFLVNTTTGDNQTLPTITPLLDGRFVVAWSDFSQSGADKSQAAVRAQIFDPRTEAVNLTGSGSGDDLVGTRFKDVLNGAAGDDQLDGDRGADTLTGGLGADGFAFTAELNKKTKADTITDFSATEDTILIDNAVFKGVGKSGGLKGKFFYEGKKAHDGNDRIIYNDASGKLIHDRNGDEKGGTTTFAKLTPGLDLDADQILVI